MSRLLIQASWCFVRWSQYVLLVMEAPSRSNSCNCEFINSPASLFSSMTRLCISLCVLILSFSIPTQFLAAQATVVPLRASNRSGRHCLGGGRAVPLLIMVFFSQTQALKCVSSILHFVRHCLLHQIQNGRGLDSKLTRLGLGDRHTTSCTQLKWPLRATHLRTHTIRLPRVHLLAFGWHMNHDNLLCSMSKVLQCYRATRNKSHCNPVSLVDSTSM